MKVLIVGGGAAGWMTSLALQKADPSLQIELIESEELGILGAGESLPSGFNIFLDKVDIDKYEFIKETESTYKVGVRFNEWVDKSSMYLNLVRCSFYENSIFKNEPRFGVPERIAYSFPLETDLNIADFEIFCYVNKIDINKLGNNKFTLENKAPYLIDFDEHNKKKFIKMNGYALHINAKLTAKFLRKKAEERGIIRREGKIIKINGTHPIESVEDDKGNVHKFDFIFDCSGFAKLIIGKHLNAKWVDMTKSLPVNTTIPFFIPIENEITPYTTATAMKYGWMFRVPTKNRYGCGYIFDSNYIDKEQAINEVVQKLGHDVQLVNFFKFTTGYYKEPYNSNCIAVGLSSGFLEPMAATSIGGVVTGLMYILDEGAEKFFFDDDCKNRYNQQQVGFTEQRMCEVFMHYVTPRNDTEFWRHFKNRDNWPTYFRTCFENAFSGEKFDWRRFALETDIHGHTAIPKIIGNRWFHKRIYDYYHKNNLKRRYQPVLQQMIEITEKCESLTIDHKEFLSLDLIRKFKNSNNNSRK